MAAQNHVSIKLSADFVDDARAEAEIAHRSAGAQVEYWAKLGRAFENAPDFTVDRAREMLTGQKMLDGLSAAEWGPAMDRLSDFFTNPDPAIDAHYARLGAQEGAVGTDGKGGIVRQTSRRLRRAG